MKKIYTVAALLLSFIFSASAQYNNLHVTCAGGNPGGLNTEIEEPSAIGWTLIQGQSQAPVWSAVTNIPFTFTFNGSPVTSYKISTT